MEQGVWGTISMVEILKAKMFLLHQVQRWYAHSDISDVQSQALSHVSAFILFTDPLITEHFVLAPSINLSDVVKQLQNFCCCLKCQKLKIKSCHVYLHHLYCHGKKSSNGSQYSELVSQSPRSIKLL